MKCYGVPIRDVCGAVSQGANGSPWCAATVVVGLLRNSILPEHASRLYIHWNHRRPLEERKADPGDVQVTLGRAYIVFRCLSVAKRAGLLEAKGGQGGKREYRLTKKGRDLIGEQTCRPSI